MPLHHHPCEFRPNGCQGRVGCSAPWEYDSSPRSCDAPGPWFCQDCDDADRCEWCGLPDHLGHEASCEITQRQAEAQQERDAARFHGGDTLQTVQEQYDAAWRQKRDLR